MPRAFADWLNPPGEPSVMADASQGSAVPANPTERDMSLLSTASPGRSIHPSAVCADATGDTSPETSAEGIEAFADEIRQLRAEDSSGLSDLSVTAETVAVDVTDDRTDDPSSPDEADGLLGWILGALNQRAPSSERLPAQPAAADAAMQAGTVDARAPQAVWRASAGQVSDAGLALDVDQLARQALNDIDARAASAASLLVTDPGAAQGAAARELLNPDNTAMDVLHGTATVLPSALHAADVARAQPLAPMFAPLNTDDAQWLEGLQERIEWQIGEGLDEATIELHPAELGALTIRVGMQGQVAQVLIMAAEPIARSLLQQSMGQLRELLNASGMTLGQGRVEALARRDETRTVAGERRVDGGMASSPRRVTRVVLVDAYA